MVSFSVRPGEVVYVGDLVIAERQNSVLLASELSIEDKYNNAVASFKQIYPDIDQRPVKRLMKLSEKVKKLQEEYR